MKFTLSFEEFINFSKCLFLVSKITGTKQPLIRVDTDLSGISIQGIGNLGKIRMFIPLADTSGSVGSMVVKDEFTRVIKAISLEKSDLINFSLNKNNNLSVKLSSGNSKYSIKCFSSDMVPVIDFGQLQQIESISSQELLTGLNTKLFCKTDSEANNCFSAVKISFTQNALSFVGSDSSVLMSIKFNKQYSNNFELLVPHEVANIVQSILSLDCSDLKIGVTSTGHGIVTSEKFTYLFSTLVVKFPDVSKILSQQFEEEVLINNQKFLEKLLILNSLSDLKIAHINIKDNMVLKTTSTDSIQVDEVLPYSSKQEHDFYVLLKPLILYLNQIKSNNIDVQLGFNRIISVKTNINNVFYTLITTPVVK